MVRLAVRGVGADGVVDDDGAVVVIVSVCAILVFIFDFGFSLYTLSASMLCVCFENRFNCKIINRCRTLDCNAFLIFAISVLKVRLNLALAFYFKLRNKI